MSMIQNLVSGPQAALHLAAIAKKVLANNSSVKCLFSDPEAVFIKDMAILLNSLDIEHPVGQYLVAVCQTFNKKFGSGVKTLLTMIGLFTQAALNLKQQGLTLPVVLRLMEKYIEMSTVECEKLKIPIRALKSGHKHCESTQSEEMNFCEMGRSLEKSIEQNDVIQDGFLDLNHLSPDKAFQTTVVLDGHKTGNEGGNTNAQTECLEPYHEHDINNTQIHTHENTDILITSDTRDPTDISDNVYGTSASQCNINHITTEKCKQSLLNRSSESASDFRCTDVDLVSVTCTEHLESELGPDIFRNNTYTYTSQNKSSTHSQDEEDEFANCFDDTECKLFNNVPDYSCNSLSMNMKLEATDVNRVLAYKSLNTNTSQCKERKVRKQNIACEKFIRSGLGAGNADVKTEMSEPGFKPLVSLYKADECSSRDEEIQSDRLDEIISKFVRSNKNKKSESILNSSRHFRTIGTSHMLQTHNDSDCSKIINVSEDQSELSSYSTTVSKSLEDANEKINDPEMNRSESRLKSPLILRQLGDGLHRGAANIMQFVIQAAKIQNSTSIGKISFDTKRLHCCKIEGLPFSRSCIVNGVVVDIAAECMSLMVENQHRPQKALLVNADISPAYRHTGYKAPAPTLSYYSAETYAGNITSQTKWASGIRDTLTELQVTVILCRGTVCEDIKYICDSLHILVVENVSYRALAAVSFVSHTDLLSYIIEASECNVCENLMMHPWLPDWGTKGGQQCAVIECHSNILQTFVLCSPCKDLCDVREQEFWQCANRLSFALSDGSLLPGSGQTEKHCSEFLRSITGIGLGCDDMLENAVASILADVFQEFYNTVTAISNLNSCHCGELENYLTRNKDFRGSYNEMSSMKPFMNLLSNCDECKDNCSENLVIYDNFVVKMEAWKTAIQSVAVVLQTDTYIQTGVSADVAIFTGKQNVSVL